MIRSGDGTVVHPGMSIKLNNVYVESHLDLFIDILEKLEGVSTFVDECEDVITPKYEIMKRTFI